MPDDKRVKGPRDQKMIDINDPSEVRDWCKALGVNKEELVDAVDAVGPYADDVRAYLKANVSEKMILKVAYMNKKNKQ